MRRLILTCIALLASGLGPASAEEPGWSRQGLLDEMSRLVGEQVTPEPTNGMLRLIDPTEEAACFMTSGDTTVFVSTGRVGSVLLVGDAGRVHSLEFYFPVVNMSADDHAEEYYQSIFRYLFPAWDAAGRWPIDSLRASWDATGRAMIDPTVSIDETIARHTEGGVKLSTYGVPPDFVLYRATARANCEKISPYLLASPRETIKEEAHRDRSPGSAQVLMSYIHPTPVDLSATPYFVGSSSSRQRSGDTSMVFEQPETVADIAPWADRQVHDDRHATTSAAIEDFWGYQNRYLFLVTDPILSVEIDHRPAVAVVEQLNGWANKINGIRIQPSELDAAFFSATPLPTPPREPLPTLGYVGEGTMLNYRWDHAAIDISATPMHLGRMHLYYGGVSGDKPGYYATAADGLGFTATDRASGATTRVDLTDWLAANPVAGSVETVQYMTDPTVRFDLDGKPHVLVLEGIEVVRDGAAGTVEFMTGQLFRAK